MAWHTNIGGGWRENGTVSSVIVAWRDFNRVRNTTARSSPPSVNNSFQFPFGRSVNLFLVVYWHFSFDTVGISLYHGTGTSSSSFLANL